MVSEVPSFEEFFGLTENGLSYADWVEEKEDDEDIALMINAVLVILQEFYNEHRYDTEKEWVKESLKREFNTLNKELYNTTLEMIDDYIETVHERFNNQYNIPQGRVEAEVYYDDVINSGIDSVVNQLYDEIKNKADFYNTMILATGVFTIEANFRRAIKRLSNIIKNNAHHGEKIVERKYMEFIYGEDALFDWVTSGRNTCEWCYAVESLNPQPLSALPVDHINGGCRIVPHDPTQFSDEYNDLMGWLI